MRAHLCHVEITERSLRVDGKEIAHLTGAVAIHMAAGQVPWVDVQLHPYLVTLELDADVTGWPPRPLDGIDRLRRRLGQ